MNRRSWRGGGVAGLMRGRWKWRETEERKKGGDVILYAMMIERDLNAGLYSGARMGWFKR
jgi:hypothetical protein